MKPDALSRKAEDRPAKSDPFDDRLKNRQCTILPQSSFSPETWETFQKEISTDVESYVKAAPMAMMTPAKDIPIDDLITEAYDRNPMAREMLGALRDPDVHRWPKQLRKELRIAMNDCKVVNSGIYYRERLFVPSDDELPTQILFWNHSSGPAGHQADLKRLI